MILNIIILALAMIGIVALLTLKTRETDPNGILGKISTKGDVHVVRFTRLVKYFGSQIEPKVLVSNISVMLVHLINNLLIFSRKALNAIHYRFSKVADMIKGRHVIVKKGSAASVFLKDVNEYKKELNHHNSKIE